MLIGCLFLLEARPATAEDDIEIAIGFPRWGVNPRVLQESWATVPFTAKNLAATPQDLVLSLTPEGRLDGSIWQRRLTSGPKAQFTFDVLMPMEKCEHLRVTAAHPGEKYFNVKKIPVNSQIAFRKTAFFILNDNHDIRGISNLKNRDLLVPNLAVSQVSTENIPQSLLGYGGASVVVVLEIAPRQMDQKQIQGLRQFVKAGGTLLFADPAAALALKDTALADLLPARPLRIRPIVSLPLPDQWQPNQDAGQAQRPQLLGMPNPSPHAVHWRETPGQMLEIQPDKHATVSASIEGLPLFCWKKTGLGQAGLCTVPIFDSKVRNTRMADMLWNHILSWQRPAPINTNALHNKPLKDAASRMVGFSAPSADKIGLLIILYIVLVVLIFSLGIVLRLKLWSWLGASLVAIIITAAIFGAAFKQASDKEAQTLASININLHSKTGTISDSSLGFFSKQDLRLDLKAKNSSVRFRTPPPVPGLYGNQEKSIKSFTFVRQGARSVVKKLALRALEPLYLNAYSEKVAGDFPEILPLSATPDGWHLTAPKGFDKIKSDNPIYLVLPNGFLKVKQKKSREWEFSSTESDSVQLDPVHRQIEAFLRSGNLPTPSVVTLSQVNKPLSWLEISGGRGFQQLQKLVDVYPAYHRVAADQNNPLIPLGSEAIAIEASGRGAGALYWENEWQELKIPQKAASYTLGAKLPPEFMSRMVIEQIQVEVSALDPTGKVEVKPALIVPETAGRVPAEDGMELLAPRKRNGDKYLFPELNDHNILDPVSGRVYMRLKVTNTKPASRTNALSGAGQWRIKRLKVDIKGRIRKKLLNTGHKP
ncbi:MAG: hypothetical protein R6V56_01075 [Lentisphaeria bacterium]